MKNSNIPWIGEIPSDWEIGKMLYALEMPITDGPHETPQLYDTGIPFLSAEAVKNGKLNFNLKRGYISDEFYQECCKKYIPQPNDIYMIKSGATTGNVAIVETSDIFQIWSPLAVFRSNRRMLYKYLYYQLISESVQKQIQLNWSYGTQQNIGMRVLEKTICLFPPLKTQQKIADFLDAKCSKIDSTIEQEKKQIIKLKEYRQSLITEAVTKGINPNVPMKDSGIEWIGEIPQGWNLVTINRLFTIKAGGDLKTEFYSDKKSDEFPYPIYTNANDANAVYGYTSKAFFPADAITVSGRGEIGFAVYRESAFDAIIRLLVLTSKAKANCKFYTYFIGTVLKNTFDTSSSAINQLSTIQLSPSIIPLPPLEEQTQIADYLDTKTAQIDNAIAKKETLITKLQEYKKSLIFEAVTGKMEV